MDAMINDAARLSVKKAGGNMQRAVEIFYLMMDKIATDATMSALNQEVQQRRKGAGQALKKESSRSNVELRETKMANDDQISAWRDDLIKRSAGLNAVGAATAAGVKAYSGYKIAQDAKDAKEGKTKGPKTQGDIAIEVAKAFSEDSKTKTITDEAAKAAKQTEAGAPIEEILDPPKAEPAPIAEPIPEMLPVVKDMNVGQSEVGRVPRPPRDQPIAGALPPSGNVGQVVNANAQPSPAAVQGSEYQTQAHLQKIALAQNELAAEKGQAGMTPSTLADMFSDGELNKMVAGIMFPPGPYEDEELDSPWDTQWAEGMQ